MATDFRISGTSTNIRSECDIRVDPKDVLKKLTSLSLTAFCDQCDQPRQGMVIVDNVVFEK